MIADKIRQCETAGDDFDTTVAKVLDYHNHTHTAGRCPHRTALWGFPGGSSDSADTALPGQYPVGDYQTTGLYCGRVISGNKGMV